MKPLFIADGMLGSLARKLRILGFDVVYDVNLSDSSIIELGHKSGRIILTADQELFNTCSRTGLRAVKLGYYDDVEDMAILVENMKIALDDLTPDESRCPLCNGELHESKTRQLLEIPRRIREAHETVYLCSRCGKAYWQGSHWKKLQDFVVRVRQRVNSIRGIRNEKFGD